MTPRKSCVSNLLKVTILCGVIKVLGANIPTENGGPSVRTDTGSVIGKYVKVLDKSIATFQGIPFAKPPIGDKRFSKPEPIGRWKNIVYAREKPPACMQYSSRNINWIPSKLNKSEDCLYLNIWTPANYNTSNKLPVLVWIYGGGYFAGASSLDMYDGSILAALGNVVVVSMNYRVGVFGFLNGGTSEAPGNLGLYDQLLALKWINKNIIYFGGDSNCITIFGESVGSTSVSLHSISPLSKGLFQRAIQQSGTSYQPNIIESSSDALDRANTFAEIVGCSNRYSNLNNNASSVIKCLKQKSALELAYTENYFTSKFPTHFRPSFGNNCKDCNDFLPESPIKMSESSKIEQVPLLAGNVRDEATTVFLNYIFPDIFSLEAEPDLHLAQAENIIKILFSDMPGVSSLKVFDFYFKDIKENSKSDIVRAISNSLSDYVFVCPTLFFTEKTKKSYYYWMTHRSQKDKNSKWTGVAHLTDVFYVFGAPFVNIDEYTEEDRKFSRNMIEKWVTFARTGQPLNKDGNESWSRVQEANPMAYELNLNKEGMMPFPRKEACEFWRPYILSQYDSNF